MAEQVRIDTATVKVGAGQIGAAAEDASRNLNKHHEQLAEASERWVGSSQRALNELVERWSTDHERRHKAINQTIDNTRASATAFRDTEDHNATGIHQAGDSL